MSHQPSLERARTWEISGPIPSPGKMVALNLPGAGTLAALVDAARTDCSDQRHEIAKAVGPNCSKERVT